MGYPSIVQSQKAFMARRYQTARAHLDDPALALGVNIVDGHVTYPAVADVFGLPSVDVNDFLHAAPQA